MSTIPAAQAAQAAMNRTQLIGKSGFAIARVIASILAGNIADPVNATPAILAIALRVGG